LTDWKLVLRENGFSGVTFAKRPDVRYGLRPTPYYQIDGERELLEEIRRGLMDYGINSTIHETKYFTSLEIFGIKNCLELSEQLNIQDDWSNSLRNDFVKKRHLTEKGIKAIHKKFGIKSLLSYDDVCNIVDAAKENRLKEKLDELLY